MKIEAGTDLFLDVRFHLSLFKIIGYVTFKS